MGQSLASPVAEASTLSARLKNKKVLNLSGTFTVPTGVGTLYYTGVAAGGRDSSTALAPYTNWGGTNLAIGVSASEGVCFGTAHSTATTSTAPRLDPVGRKASQMGALTSIAANGAGGEAFAADNGFMLTHSIGNIAPNRSLDGGRTWTSAGSAALAGNYNTMALAPIANSDAPTSENRGAYVLSTSTGLAVWSGTAWADSTTYTGKAFSCMSYANGYFIAGENNATTKTGIYYKLAADAITGTGWATVVIDAANNNTVNDIFYGGGLYVAVCVAGALYTASTIDGTWTARTSGTTSAIYGIRYAAGRWVGVCGAGITITSTDGITWTATTAIGSASVLYRKDLVYLPTTAQWCITQNTTAGLYYSTNGTTWTSHAAGLSVYASAATSVGLLALDSGASYLIPDPAKAFYYTLSTSGDGGGVSLLRVSDNTELLRLQGGFSGLNGAYSGWGGSSTLTELRGKGMGQAGFGANGILSTGTGAAQLGGVPGGNIIGGGAALMLQDLINNDGMSGIKIPGGSSSLATSSGACGGGSLMAWPGVGYDLPGAGPGAGGGGAIANQPAGGGGEGIVRFAIAVTPGEILAYSNGLAQRDNAVGAPQMGFGMFEWE